MKFLKLALIFCVIMLLFSNFSVAQQKQKSSGNRGSITGSVREKSSSEALPYVSVAILKTDKDSTLLDGGITDTNGVFRIRNVAYGKYIIKFSFIGYADVYKNISLNKSSLNIGTVELESRGENLKEVKIVGTKQMMEYQLDKRVINVDKNIVSQGGNASDVLEDVPSVEIDDEGNVSLRGNSNVTLLIDGKPSSLYGSDVPSVLAQIPASQIDKIEVITNPSAKYNPEGMSGIINITLKEKGNMGLNGNVNVSTGTAIEKWLPNESITASLNYSTKKFSIGGSIDLRYDKREHRQDNVRLFKPDTAGNIDFIRTKRNGGEESLSYGISLNGEYYINQLNTIGLIFNTHAHKSLDDWANTSNTNLTRSNSPRTSLDMTDGDNDGSFNNIGLTYEKKFKNKKDELFYASFTWSWGDFNHNFMDSVDYYGDYTAMSYIQNDTSTSDHSHAIADIHFVYPFSEKTKLEVGYNLNYSSETSHYTYYTNHFIDSASTYDFERQEQIHALYATFGFGIGEKFSAQIGLRGEMARNDFKRTMISGKIDDFDKDYNSLYPTIHLSYALNRNHSFQISYSRRIRRPDPWTMMPNIDLTNPEYIRFGNPNIDPEYTNAFELGWSWMFKKTTIFTSAYYRAVNNGMTRFEFLWDEANAVNYGFGWAWEMAGEGNSSRTAQSFINLAHSSNYGTEIIIDREWTSWWKMNISGNAFGSYQDGSEMGYDKVRSFNFNAKLSTTFSLPKDFTVQISGRYYAKRKTIQGERNARYDFDLAIRKPVLNKQGTISLNFRDVFNTRGGGGYSYTDQYISWNYFRPYSQSIRLSFSYNFGKTANAHKLKQKQQSDAGYSGSFDESE